MPSFFSFQQGNEDAAARFNTDASPLLGRFRAVPRSSASAGAAGEGRRLFQQPPHGARSGSLGLLSAYTGGGDLGGGRGSVHVGYGTLLAAQLDAAAAEEDGEEGDDDDDDEDEDADDGNSQSSGGGGGLFGSEESRRRRRGRRGRINFARRARKVWRRLDALWISPRQGHVRRVVEKWWTRWSLLVVLPALLAVAWCALPFPQYPLPDDQEDGHDGKPDGPFLKLPGHGTAKVQVNFWFFLFVFYGFYNLTALGIWITKVFNIYSLNWWPTSLGFPITVTAVALLHTLAPIPIYLIPETNWLTKHNTAWVTWTFCLMAAPVAIAFLILMTNERHLGLRHSLSETQRIFTTSWWTGEPDTISRRGSGHNRRRPHLSSESFDPDVAALLLDSGTDREDGGRGGAGRGGVRAGGAAAAVGGGSRGRPSLPVRLRRRWLPASFVRFVWFCLALAIGLLVYVIGEAYAEIYLRTLPHNSLETVVYVYGWILTVYLLDGLTGWILGGNEGERVGSYPLSWIFKLYFMLTYQTYVRALYARLRSRSQFVYLQLLSSTTLIIITPLTMSATFHWLLTVLGLNGQSYGSYQKIGVRNVFIRFLAEEASMLAFLGSILVLHFGPNKDVYPYFSFDDDDSSEGYNFRLTFWASGVTWACEMAASFIVAGLIRWIYGVSVVEEGKLDLAIWPELLPTSVAVVLHVLQNMLFSIICLQFR